MMVEEVWSHFMRVVHATGMGDATAWAKLDLTMQQMKVIMMLEHRGEMPVSALAESLNVSLPSMTGIVDRLVQNDLVERVPSPTDRRVILLRCTDKAREIFDGLFLSSFKRFQEMMNGLKPTDREMISIGLRLLSQAYDQYSRTSQNENAPSTR